MSDSSPVPPPKSFSCRSPSCGKLFTTSSNRSRHERIHLSESHECALCTTRFISNEALSQHALGCAGSLKRKTPPPADEQPAKRPRPVSYTEDDGKTHETQYTPLSDDSDSHSEVEEMKPVIDEDKVEQVSEEFITWLSQGAHTVFEQSIKRKRMTSPAQVRPIKTNIRFLFGELISLGICTADTIQMIVFTRLDLVQQLMECIKGRGVGAGRIYALVLLMKKIVIFLCSKQSLATRHHIPPQTVASFQYIDSLCDEMSRQKKMNREDRSVLQLTASRDCRTSDQLPKALVSLTVDDMRHLVERCLSQLKASVSTKDAATRYTAHLITVSFVLLLGPRQAVFRQLRHGESLVREEMWLIKLKSSQTKNGKAVLLQIPAALTLAYDYYLSTVRPLLIEPQAHDTGFVFIQRNNEQREDFSSLTREVTRRLIQKETNAHRFRHALASSFHSYEGSNTRMMGDLALAMNHDVRTQQSHYVQHEQIVAQESLHRHLKVILQKSIDAPD
jgi:hypothetical protein